METDKCYYCMFADFMYTVKCKECNRDINICCSCDKHYLMYQKCISCYKPSKHVKKSVICNDQVKYSNLQTKDNSNNQFIGILSTSEIDQLIDNGCPTDKISEPCSICFKFDCICYVDKNDIRFNMKVQILSTKCQHCFTFNCTCIDLRK
jgi:hypothetical protein